MSKYALNHQEILELSETTGVKRTTIIQRLKYGWSRQEVLAGQRIKKTDQSQFERWSIQSSGQVMFMVTVFDVVDSILKLGNKHKNMMETATIAIEVWKGLLAR